MKNVLFVLLLALFAVAGVVASDAQAGTCPGRSATGYCSAFDNQSSDGAIGSTTNEATKVGTCYVVSTSSSVVSFWGLRQYASVSTGAIQYDLLYPLTVTSGVVEIPVNTIFANGVYADAITGSVISICGYTK